jgi:hypothetical protein
MVGCLIWHVGKFNFSQPSPAWMEEIRIFVFSYPHRRRHVTYSELPTKYMWESCKSSFLDIKLVYASTTALWPDFVAQAIPKRHVMARVLMNFTLWLTTIQNSFRNIENFLDIYRISYRVDLRTTQLTKRTRPSRYFWRMSNLRCKFSSRLWPTQFCHVISCNFFIINVYWGIYIHIWTLLQK